MSYQIHRELADGRWVCARHGGQRCYKCGVDYRHMQPTRPRQYKPRRYRGRGHYGYYDDNGYDDEPIGQGLSLSVLSIAVKEPHVYLSWKLVRGTGQILATKFVPPFPEIMPLELFCGRRRDQEGVMRYTLPDDHRTMIIHTDGACSNNGYPNAQAGFGFWHGCSRRQNRLVESCRLENRGPFGDHRAQTSNRAELRAAIAALRFRRWYAIGARKVVIATDSTYVTNGATDWAKIWVRNNWVRSGEPVANQDLWEVLLGEIEHASHMGMETAFWRISRDLNTVADAAASAGADVEYLPPFFTDVY